MNQIMFILQILSILSIPLCVFRASVVNPD